MVPVPGASPFDPTRKVVSVLARSSPGRFPHHLLFVLATSNRLASDEQLHYMLQVRSTQSDQHPDQCERTRQGLTQEMFAVCMTDPGEGKVCVCVCVCVCVSYRWRTVVYRWV